MSFTGDRRGYDPQQEARTRLVHEHLRFKPDAERQDLFSLDEAVLEELRVNVPKVDPKDKVGLNQMGAGTVVYQKRKSGYQSFGVVYEYSPSQYQGSEKRVRPLYEVVELERGKPERRWYKWEKDPKTGQMKAVAIKALTSKKEARGGAAVDAPAHWKRFREGDRLVEERQDFNGDRYSIAVTSDKKKGVLSVRRVERSTVTKTGSTQQIDDFTRPPHAVRQIVIDGEALPERALNDLGRQAGATLELMQQAVNPSEIEFKHGSYYQDEN